MKLKPSICLTLITFLLILPYSVYSETNKTKRIFETKNGQIIIESISFDFDNKKSVFTFTGDVEASYKDMNISCQKLEIFFKGSLKDSSSEESKPSLEKVVATESVTISIASPEVGNATAGQAVYYPASENIVFTGNPYVKYGDRVEGGGIGTTVTLNRKEESFHVQGTKENKAQAKARIDSGKDEER